MPSTTAISQCRSSARRRSHRRRNKSPAQESTRRFRSRTPVGRERSREQQTASVYPAGAVLAIGTKFRDMNQFGASGLDAGGGVADGLSAGANTLRPSHSRRGKVGLTSNGTAVAPASGIGPRLRYGRAASHSAVQRSPRSYSSASLSRRSAMALSSSARASRRYLIARALVMARIRTQQNIGFKSGGGAWFLGTLHHVLRAERRNHPLGWSLSLK
jgi:hypothetical protein